MKNKILVIVVFALLQTAMVLVGHYVGSIRSAFGPLGMGLSLVAGVALGRIVSARPLKVILWGALAGGLSGMVGIAVSVSLLDVPSALLLYGTAGSAVAGGIGGLLSSRLMRTRSTVDSTSSGSK